MTTATPETKTKTVAGTCHHDCPDSCGWLVTVDHSGPEPVAVKLRGNPEHPYSKGELCPKVNRFLDVVYSPSRILTPLRRCGPKGSGQFTPVSWAEALQTVAERWREIVETTGGEGIMPLSDAGNQSSLALHAHGRLMDRLGASRMVDSVCGQTAGEGVVPVYGTKLLADPESIEHAQLILLWGTNTKLTNRHLWPYIAQARDNGATVVHIDPLRTATSEAADMHLQPLPGTDIALMLAVFNELILRDVIDHDYIAEYTTGFAELAVECSQWSVQRASDVTGLAPDQILALVDLIVAKAPLHARTVIGAEHRERGAGFFRTLSMLPLLMGSWRHRGGGMSRSVGSYSEGQLSSLASPHLLNGADPRALSMNQAGRWLNDADPAVRSLFVWNFNPIVSLPNADEIRRGLKREDLFTVVHELFMTDTARYADIIFPAVTQIEANDVVPSWGSLHLNWNEAAIAPRGESVSNPELARRLAVAMGFDEPELLASDDDLLADLFAGSASTTSGVTLQQVQTERAVRVVADDFQPYAAGGFPTPDGRAHFASAELEHNGWGRVPTYHPATEGPDGPLGQRFPLCLMTPKFHTRFLNSSYNQHPRHAGLEGGPFVELSAADAAARHIAEGDIVRVFNDRATVEVVARIGTMVRDAVVAIPYGWGAHSYRYGVTANALTNDTLVDWGGGVAYSDTMVEVTKI